MTEKNLQPQNIDAEKAVLAAMMIEKNDIGDVLTILSSDDFYIDLHAKIFTVCKDLYINNLPIDIISVAEKMQSDKDFESKGKGLVLTQMIDSIDTTANVIFHANIVKEKALLRNLLTVSSTVHKKILDGADDAKTILDFAQKSVADVAISGIKGGFVAVKDMIVPTMKNIERLVADKKDIPNLRTGFDNFDKRLGGLAKGELIIIAGRPSMGKTTFALNIGLNVAKDDRTSAAAIFSLEMNKESLMNKFVSNLSQINSRKIASGYIAEQQFGSITQTMNKLNDINLFIDDRSDMTVFDCRIESRKLFNKLKTQGIDLKLIIIDYLQLLSSNRQRDSRALEVSEISRNLKGLARDLNIPVIALSQLNRQTEDRGRKNNKPRLSDLRDSGAIEQDADVVVFVHRDGYYDKSNEAIQNDATLIIEKNRNGITCEVPMIFKKEISRFFDKD